MSMTNFYKYTILLSLATIGLLVNLFYPTPVVVALPLTIGFFALVGGRVGQWLFKEAPRFSQMLLGSGFYLLAVSSILTLLYYANGFSKITLTTTVVITAFLTLCIPAKKKSGLKFWDETTWSNLWPLLPALAGEGALLAIIFSRRFDDTLISPWTLFGPRFFIVAFVVTLTTLFTLFRAHRKYAGILLSVFFARILSVAALIFAYGFGFDPFVHEAAMKWILEFGELFPKTPYYIGEYMLIVPIHLFTHLPLSLIHQIFLPLIVAVFLPTLYLLQKKSPALLPLLALWPLSFFIQTTPNNLALCFVFFASLLLFLSQNEKKPYIPLALLLIAATSIHPFIGIPGFFAFSTYILFEKQKRILALGTSFALLLVTPMLLIAYGYLGGASPTFTSIIQHPDFINLLLAPPYWWLYEGKPLVWQILYAYRFLLPYIIIVITFFFSRKQKNMWVLFLIGAHICLSAIILTSFSIPGVINYERGAYASRLLAVALVLFFPFFLDILEKQALPRLQNRTWQIVWSVASAFLLMISWYFTYPTRDQISKHTGYAVRKADIEAVHFIQQRNGTSTDYIVLTNQTVASAALREFSFKTYHQGADGGEHYIYSIPTGGPLYQWFRKMVYEEPKRQWMEEAMRFAGVKKAYLIHTNYWYPAAELRDAAKKEAEHFFDIGPGRAWIYEYTLPSTPEESEQVSGQ